MRVISGNCRGRKLTPISGGTIRPTSDRVKEAVFNILGQDISGTRVLDLFSGTGALGIEALSRGACHAVFVDKEIQTTWKNLERCGFTESAHVIQADLLNSNSLKILEGQIFDIIFIDPPYGKKNISHVIENKYFTALMDEQSIVIAEHGAKENLILDQPLLDIYRQKKYSKTMISFIRKIP